MNDERKILSAAESSFSAADNLSSSIWLTSTAITELILVLQTVQSLVIRETFKERFVSSFAMNHAKCGSSLSRTAGEACVQVLCRAGEQLRGAPGESQSRRAPLATLSIEFWVI